MKRFINRHADDHEYTSRGGAGVSKVDVERPVSYIVKFELDDHGSRRKGKTRGRGPYLWHLTELNTETPIKVNEPPLLVQADPWPWTN